jgi:hypothetical protein
VGRFPLLRQLNELTPLLENDDASRRAVQACAYRYLNARRQHTVNVIECDDGYNDFNDVWKAMSDG